MGDWWNLTADHKPVRSWPIPEMTNPEFSFGTPAGETCIHGKVDYEKMQCNVTITKGVFFGKTKLEEKDLRDAVRESWRNSNFGLVIKVKAAGAEGLVKAPDFAEPE